MPKKNEYSTRPASKGGVKLRLWMERQGISLREMCKEHGWNPTSVHSYIVGDKKPSLDMANKIERETGVPMRSWCTEN